MSAPLHNSIAGEVLLLSSFVESGGVWRTVNGAHVYIKDGKVAAGPAHLMGKSAHEVGQHASPHPRASFTTGKGSTYHTQGAGTTRHKAATGENFSASHRTVYVTPEGNQNVLEHLQQHNIGNTKAAIRSLPDGRVGLVVKDKATGNVRHDLSRIIPHQTTPAVGLHPVEIWDKHPTTGEYAHHIGHAITAITPQAAHLSRAGELALVTVDGVPSFGTLELARDDEDGGRWVTIDGTHVLIRGGRIVEGPAALRGKPAKIHPVSSSQHGGHAPAGGVVHESNGQEYKGGQRLPTHGHDARPPHPLFSGKAEPATSQNRLFGSDAGSQAAARAAGKVDSKTSLFGTPLPVGKHEGLFGENALRPAEKPAEEAAHDDGKVKASANAVDPKHTAPLPFGEKKAGEIGIGSRVTVTSGEHGGKSGTISKDTGRDDRIGRYGVKFDDGTEGGFHDTSMFDAGEERAARQKYHEGQAKQLRTTASDFRGKGIHGAADAADEEAAKHEASAAKERAEQPKTATPPAPSLGNSPSEKPSREQISAAIARHRANGKDTAQAVAAAHRELGIGNQPAPKAEKVAPVRAVAKQKAENANLPHADAPKATEPPATPSDAGKAAAERASGVVASAKERETADHSPDAGKMGANSLPSHADAPSVTANPSAHPDEYKRQLSKAFVDKVNAGESGYKAGSVRVGENGVLQQYLGKKDGWRTPAEFEPAWTQAAHDTGSMHPSNQQAHWEENTPEGQAHAATRDAARESDRAKADAATDARHEARERYAARHGGDYAKAADAYRAQTGAEFLDAKPEDIDRATKGNATPSDAGAQAATRAARLHAQADKQRKLAERSATPEYHHHVADSLDAQAKAVGGSPAPTTDTLSPPTPAELATDGALPGGMTPKEMATKAKARLEAIRHRNNGNESAARRVEEQHGLTRSPASKPLASEQTNQGAAEHKPSTGSRGGIDFDREFGSSPAKREADRADIAGQLRKGTTPTPSDEGQRAAARAAGIARTAPMHRSTFPVSGPAGKAVVEQSGGKYLVKDEGGSVLHIGSYESAMEHAKEYVTHAGRRTA